VLAEPEPQGLGHGRARARVVALEFRVPVVTQPEEVEHFVVDRLGVCEEPAAVHHMNTAAEQLVKAFQLIGVMPAGHVAVVLVAVAVVSGLADDPLGLPGQALVLQLQGQLERLGLITPGQLVRMG
jgi:hypothetical protein